MPYPLPTITVAFDEAGNSGQNLLDKDQPVFVVASVSFSNTDLKTLSKIVKSNAKELHFKDLRRGESGRKIILDILNNELITPEKVKVFVVDKRFSVLARIVDILAEPVFYDKGIDLYRNAQNRCLSNLIYLFGQNIWHKNLFDNLLEKFVAMVRFKSIESIEEFYASANTLSSFIIKDDESGLLSEILESENILDEILPAIDKYAIDLTLAAFVVLIGYWQKQTTYAIRVVSDSSKQIKYYNKLLAFISAKILPEQEVGFGERKFIYPLRISKIELINSTDDFGVQLADVFASAFCYYYKTELLGTNDELAKRMGGTRAFNGGVFSDFLWHVPLFTPEDWEVSDETGVNPLDYWAEQMRNYGAIFGINKS